MRAEKLDFPLRHPSSFETCAAADDYTAAQMFVPPLSARVLNKLQSVLRR
jgi:hypothetical protein